MKGPAPPDKACKSYPYLLGGLKITQANHVWCADITCPIPDDHIAPGRSALFLAWPVLRSIRDEGYDANQVA